MSVEVVQVQFSVQQRVSAAGILGVRAEFGPLINSKFRSISFTDVTLVALYHGWVDQALTVAASSCLNIVSRISSTVPMPCTEM